MQLHLRIWRYITCPLLCQVPCDSVNDSAHILSNSRAAFNCGSLDADEALAYDIQVR